MAIADVLGAPRVARGSLGSRRRLRVSLRSGGAGPAPVNLLLLERGTGSHGD